MAKRFYYPQQNGERKRAKLDITISDHNFPLSQNSDRNKDENQTDNWGDDNDDEILLLASQACEEAYSGNNSTLPDYSFCMQPSSTSTQINDPGPSTSKNAFTFKKPMKNALNVISTNLKNKCELISSPLPGMSKVIQKTNHENLVEDMIFNDKIYKGDADHVYRQFLHLQEENSKLKFENGKLQEKCVTKEGEVSILRTQLKASHMTADNVRLEKIKVQERVQMEWTDKLMAVNKQLQDLRTQLDFKNLEITSVKEKCKMLESSKVKLTQVTLAKNDILSSHRHNSTHLMTSDMSSPQFKKVKTLCKNVQTESSTSPYIIELNTTCRNKHKKLSEYLPLILEPTIEQHSILEYNEKLQRPTDTITNRCKVFSTFHRIPDTPCSNKVRAARKLTLNNIYEDLAFIAGDKGTEDVHQRLLNIFKATGSILKEVQQQLKTLAQRTTTAFQKEMDEKYIEGTSSFLVITEEDLICGKPLYKEEQAVNARRITAILYHVLEHPEALEMISRGDSEMLSPLSGNSLGELINGICVLLDKTSCAILYSGLLLSVTKLLDRILTRTKKSFIIQVIKTIIESRPMLFVSCEILRALRKLATKESPVIFCRGGNTGNLKLDYDQGVLLYKKDSCFLQVLLKQVEASVMCIEKQNLREQAVAVSRELLLFYTVLNEHPRFRGNLEKPSCECECRQIFLQVIVFSLRTCVLMLRNKDAVTEWDTPLLSVCRSGLQVLYQCVQRDAELCPQLGYNEGHLMEFCEVLREFPHDELYSHMLSEMTSTFQPSPEDSPSSFHREPWLKSFQTFSLVD